MPLPPCRVGDNVDDIETPALVVQLDGLEKNLKTMADIMKSFPGVDYRPHAKAHKCPAIAHMQVSHGAVGVCCQTLEEVETMVNSGIKDVFFSNEIVSDRKLKRFTALAKMAKLSVCVDCETIAENLSAVAKEMDVVLNVLVEVNVGGNRCGIEPGEAVGHLVKKITNLSCLNFGGLHCYNGVNQHIRKAEDRKRATDEVTEKVQRSLEVLETLGIQCKKVTGGGTGTFTYEASSGVFTEVQPGSYPIMDVDYGQNLDKDDKLVSDFDQTMYVLSTVISVQGTRVITDAGLKALGLDSGMPKVLGRPEVKYNIAGDEHGKLSPAGKFKVGDKVWLIPGHCDPTVKFYNHMCGVRNGCVETVWPLSS